MQRTLAIFALASAVTGCTNSVAVQREAEVFSSLPYDNIACADLEQQRDTLAARHGVERDVEREPQAESSMAGIGIIVPDIRSTDEREKARAIGEISAMNQSMRRRQCASD